MKEWCGARAAGREEETEKKASSSSVLAPASMFEASQSLLHLLVVGNLGELLLERSRDDVIPFLLLEARALHVGESGGEVFRRRKPAPVREERRRGPPLLKMRVNCKVSDWINDSFSWAQQDKHELTLSSVKPRGTLLLRGLGMFFCSADVTASARDRRGTSSDDNLRTSRSSESDATSRGLSSHSSLGFRGR